MNGSAGSAGRRLTGEAETVATTTRAELVHDGDTLRLLMANGGKVLIFSARQSGGLGLVGMEERLRLLRGTVAVQTNPGVARASS